MTTRTISQPRTTDGYFVDAHSTYIIRAILVSQGPCSSGNTVFGFIERTYEYATKLSTCTHRYLLSLPNEIYQYPIT